ncbi:MAG: thiolase family protein, partial [Proteobacteria bacterium]|nr:thiolase family protein [Pseudomonadota bacterium]
MRDVYVVGIHTLRFGRYLEKSIKDLACETTAGCLADAGVDKADIQALWFANSGWGDSGQSCIRGQVALRPMGVDKIPITNVENACAGGSTAFHHAWLGVASGLYDLTMAVGAEKLYNTNRMAIFAGFLGGIDIEDCVNIVKNLTDFQLTDEDQKKIEAFRAKYPPPARKPGKKKPKSVKERARDRLKEIKDQAVVAIRLGEALGYGAVRELAKAGGGDHSPFMDVYGFAARQHMKPFGSTVEQLAIVA